MPGSLERRRKSRQWRRDLLALALAPAAIALLSGAAPPVPAMGTLTVVKRDADSKAPLMGTTFVVHLNDPRGPTVDPPPPPTDTNGMTQAQLAVGHTYCLEETAVTPGYLRLPIFSPAQCVDLTPEQPKATIGVTDPPVGTLKVTKTDLSGTPVTTPGAKFNVHQDTPTGQVVAALTTDASGSGIVHVAPGATYCLEETAAPAGFQVAPTYTPDACAAVTAGAASSIKVADPPTPTPTPSPSPMPTGELQVVKTDMAGKTVTTPGFTFNVTVGTTSGPVIATISTDGSGTAIAGALNPAIYCVAETAVPDGYQLAPTYSPSACIAVVADPTQGHNPSTITVADPPSTTPSPSTSTAAAGGPSQEPPLGATGRLAATEPTGPSLPMGALAKALVGFGLLLLLVGGTIIVFEVRRRRQAALELPPDTW